MFSMRLDKGPWLNQSRILDASPVDDELDDITGVLHCVCQCLANEGVTLEVGGFGQSRWPLDVGTDLLTLLEQLPEVMNAIQGQPHDFSIDFYEQGIQRRIDFRHTGNCVIARCVSSTDWIPNPAEELISAEDLRLMLTTVARDVLEIAATYCSNYVSNPLFEEWARLLLVGHD